MFPLSLYFSDQQVTWTAVQLWNNISAYHCVDEKALTRQLTELYAQHCQQPPVQTDDQNSNTVHDLFEATFAIDNEKIRGKDIQADPGINEEEQRVLLSLAEHFLHLPDQQSIGDLIDSRLNATYWHIYFAHHLADIHQTHFWQQGINTKRITVDTDAAGIFRELVKRIDSDIISDILLQITDALREQIIYSSDIHQGLQKLNSLPDKLTCDFTILGENAVSAEAARQYYNQCLDAITAIAAQRNEKRPTPSLSLKLSALHPRLEPLKSSSVITALTQRMQHLLIIARSENVQLMIEAEESNQQELVLHVLDNLLCSDLCQGWGGLGITLQAYSKRAIPILGWLNFMAEKQQTSIPVRLVKGGYLNREITQAAVKELPDYPVYTQEKTTELSYRLCARYLLSDHCPLLIPRFATHNQKTLAHVLHIAGQSLKPVELQRQQGSEKAIHNRLSLRGSPVKQRLYAPLGDQRQLREYLSRWLKDNIISRHLMPAALNGKHSSAVLLDSQQHRQRFLDKLSAFRDKQWLAAPLINGEPVYSASAVNTTSPHDLKLQTGEMFSSTIDDVREAYTVARTGFIRWNRRPVSERAQIINRFIGLLEQHRDELIALSIREAGKTINDALSEIRETIELCHSYTAQAVSQLTPQPIASLAGETETLIHQGRGIFVCISPWNYPLAIWTGQVVAALLAGNVVIAKPANTTPLIAYRAAELLLEAGVAKDALALLPGNSENINTQLIKDFRLGGIAFSGSNASANAIARQLAQRESNPAVPFMTSTGGLSIMLADSSLSPEQIVRDVIKSAFNSAGQRCAALRVLYLENAIADQVETMLIEAIHTLKTGDPSEPDTDLGPIIDNHALQALHGHIEHCRAHGRLLFEADLNDQHDSGYFVAPTLIRLHSIDELSDEHFGPVLHIIRYQKGNADRIAEEINRIEHGLSLTINSTDKQMINALCQLLRPCNINKRRHLSDSFDGQPRIASAGLSGTAPRVGGPHYLAHFTQQLICRSC